MVINTMTLYWNYMQNNYWKRKWTIERKNVIFLAYRKGYIARFHCLKWKASGGKMGFDHSCIFSWMSINKRYTGVSPDWITCYRRWLQLTRLVHSIFVSCQRPQEGFKSHKNRSRSDSRYHCIWLHSSDRCGNLKIIILHGVSGVQTQISIGISLPPHVWTKTMLPSSLRRCYAHFTDQRIPERGNFFRGRVSDPQTRLRFRQFLIQSSKN